MQYNEQLDPGVWPRALKSLLALKWCGDAIERHEARHGENFEVVAYTRPDLLRASPVKPWCLWSNLRQTVAVCPYSAKDGAWAVPRKLLHHFTSQADAYASCHDLRSKTQIAHGSRFQYQRLVSCCFTGESLLGYVVKGLPQDPLGCDIVHDSSFLRQVQRSATPVGADAKSPIVHSRGYRHVCGVALSKNYENGVWANNMMNEMGGLPIETGIALRRLFGNDTDACMEALTPYDRATGAVTSPRTWRPFFLSPLSPKLLRDLSLFPRALTVP